MQTRCIVPLQILCFVISFAVAQVPDDPGEPGVITGRVIDSDGRPLRDARVYAKERNRPQRGTIRYVTTDPNGRFRLVNLRPGDYDVIAVPSNSTSMLSSWRHRVHLAKDKPVGDVTIRLGSSAHIRS